MTEVQLKQTRFDLTAEEKQAVREILLRITKRPATGKVTLDLSQGGINSFELLEKTKDFIDGQR